MTAQSETAISQQDLLCLFNAILRQDRMNSVSEVNPQDILIASTNTQHRIPDPISQEYTSGNYQEGCFIWTLSCVYWLTKPTPVLHLIITHIFWDTFTSHGDKPSCIKETTHNLCLGILSAGGSKNLWVMIRSCMEHPASGTGHYLISSGMRYRHRLINYAR